MEFLLKINKITIPVEAVSSLEEMGLVGQLKLYLVVLQTTKIKLIKFRVQQLLEILPNSYREEIMRKMGMVYRLSGYKRGNLKVKGQALNSKPKIKQHSRISQYKNLQLKPTFQKTSPKLFQTNCSMMQTMLNQMETTYESTKALLILIINN